MVVSNNYVTISYLYIIVMYLSRIPGKNCYSSRDDYIHKACTRHAKYKTCAHLFRIENSINSHKFSNIFNIIVGILNITKLKTCRISCRTTSSLHYAGGYSPNGFTSQAECKSHHQSADDRRTSDNIERH